MTPFAALVDDLLAAVAEALRARPDVAAALRESLGVPMSTSRGPEKKYMSVVEYARHVGLSKRTVENLLRRGLPLVGRGRLRRVPVAEADAWMRQGTSQDALERRARLDARRAGVSALKVR